MVTNMINQSQESLVPAQARGRYTRLGIWIWPYRAEVTLQDKIVSQRGHVIVVIYSIYLSSLSTTPVSIQVFF